MRKALLAIALAMACTPVWAVTSDTAQQDCQDVRDAAQAGMERAIKAAIPNKDPGQVFDEATESCLKFIIDYSKFEFKIPSLGDIQGMLQQMGQDLITKACQSAQDQFDQAVQEAMGQLGEQIPTMPSLPGGIPGNGAIAMKPAGAGAAMQTPPPAQSGKDPGFFGGLINWVTGKDKGGRP